MLDGAGCATRSHMADKHPDAAAIDRLDTNAICERFKVTRQAVSYWRREGVPYRYRKAMHALGKEWGVDMPEMRRMRDRETV